MQDRIIKRMLSIFFKITAQLQLHPQKFVRIVFSFYLVLDTGD